jgi:hypothetical protein
LVSELEIRIDKLLPKFAFNLKLRRTTFGLDERQKINILVIPDQFGGWGWFHAHNVSAVDML